MGSATTVVALALVVEGCAGYAVAKLPRWGARPVPVMVAASPPATSSSGRDPFWDESAEIAGDRNIEDLSYAAQFEQLFSKPLQRNKPVPKPSNAAQRREPSAVRVPFSNVFGTLMRGARSTQPFRDGPTFLEVARP